MFSSNLKVYGKSIEEIIKSEAGGDLGRILRSIASHGRPDSRGFTDFELAKAEAKGLIHILFLIYNLLLD